jgi:hypothetical protein
LLLPLREGASWTYRLTQAEGSSEVIMTATLAADGAVLRFGMADSRLNCLDGTLMGLLPGWLGSGHVRLGDALTADNPRGSLLPEAGMLLPLGTPGQWQVELDPGGALTLPLPGGDVVTPILAGRLVVFDTVQGASEVAVPAGVFPTVQIQQDVLYELQLAASDDSPLMGVGNVSMFLYYAEGVGLIKVEFLGGMVSLSDGTAASLEPGIALELLSFNMNLTP